MKETFKQNELATRPLNITRAKDLFYKVQNQPDPKIVWNGITEGSKGLIAGVSKTGKTTLAENLAISLAVGRKDFFNFPLPNKPEKVLFINLEESYRLRSRRNLKQISTLTEEEKNIFFENYYPTPEVFPEFLNTEADWLYLQQYIQEVDPKYVFIDSLSHMVEGQIENSETGIKFIKKFRHYLGSLNKTLIIVHHNTKGNEKPIDQDSIAGSRVIAQEFEYAIGLGNVPNRNGGNYLCMLYNKHIEKDDRTAFTYKIDEINWVSNIGSCNKFDLYNENKIDYRNNTTNKDVIFDYINSHCSQHSQTIKTHSLYENFTLGENKTMSKDTLHKSINKLVEENKIFNLGKGEYSILENKQ